MSLTKEQIDQKTEDLKAFIAEHKDTKGPLMPIMQYAQGLFGYLSLEIQGLIADSLDIPLTEVYGVATFSPSFHFSPRANMSSVSAPEPPAMSRARRQCSIRLSRYSESMSEAPRRTEGLPFRIPAASAAADSLRS